MKIEAFPAIGRDARDGRPRHRLRPLDELRHQHRDGGRRPRTRTAPATPTASSSRCIRRRFPGTRQAAADVRVRARRGRPHVGAAHAGRHARRRGRSPRRSAGTSSRRSIPRTGTSSRATSRRARSSRSACTGYGIGGKRRGLSRPDAHPEARSSTSSSAGILEIYEKFVGDDPRDDADEGLPGHALLDGRPLGAVREGREDRDARRDARRRTRRRTSRASTRPARSTSRSTARTASAPTRSSRASTRARSAARRWCATARETAAKLPAADGAFADARKKRGRTEFARLAGVDGPENPHVLAEEMGDWMTDNVTVIRENGKLRETRDEARRSSSERWKNVGLTDRVDLRQPRDLVHQPAPQHARDRARHDARRAPARRVARRALQGPGPLEGRSTEENALPARRRELPEDDDRRAHARRAEDQLRARGHVAHQAAGEEILMVDDARQTDHQLQRPAPGHADVLPLLGGVRDPVPAAAERDLRPDGDREEPEDRARARRPRRSSTTARASRRSAAPARCGSTACRGWPARRSIDSLEQPIRLEPHGEVPRAPRPRRRPAGDVRGVEARQGVDPDRRHVRPRSRAPHGGGGAAAGLRVLAVHHLRQLPRRLPAGQRPLELHRRRADRAGAPLQLAIRRAR